jgi:hypothetical protein
MAPLTKITEGRNKKGKEEQKEKGVRKAESYRTRTERLNTQTTFITAVQQVKKQMMSKVDLKDRMELPNLI